ncbi:MAG TPA: patatin-like phospholipase family protein [Xanthomonadales bacterium]|nr:patatin-like phospholipase family protein [Xanthomonadales bacterium]
MHILSKGKSLTDVPDTPHVPPPGLALCARNMTAEIHAWLRLTLFTPLLAGLLGACASYGVIDNTSIGKIPSSGGYTLKSWAESDRSDDIAFLVTFSGGGTRAAAMAYGVLDELRKTEVSINGKPTRLLDEVDHISSVSGGSFTAAYYGLHGDGLFETFEDDFLRFDLDGHLARGLFNPIHWFQSTGRTERAIKYYEEILFHGATFADIMNADRPMIVINTSDLAYGIRFSFIQEYFDFLCSDLLSYPVANAVAASSAVPVVFNPVVLENYGTCGNYSPAWPDDAEKLAKENEAFAVLYQQLNTYSDKSQRKYIHFVDGGITDNMGLRALSDVVTITGGASAFLARLQRKTPRYIVLISVNASKGPLKEMDQSTKQPSMFSAMSAASNTEIQRYNTATVELAQSEINRWSRMVSSPERPVTPYFIQVSFDEVEQSQLRQFLNGIPTSFNLSDEQVDKLISSAHMLLRENPQFKQFLSDLADPSAP